MLIEKCEECGREALSETLTEVVQPQGGSKKVCECCKFHIPREQTQLLKG